MKKTVILLILLLSSLVKGQFWENPNQKPSLFGMRINRGHILGDPVGLWLMSEGFASKVFDLSGNNNTGSLLSSISWVGGKYGSCLDIPGSVSTSRVTIPDSPVYSGLSVISVSFWIYPHAWGQDGDYQQIFGKANWAGQREWRFRTEATDKLIWHISNDGDDPGANECNYDVSGLPVNAWYHIVGTYDGTTLRLYINGVEVQNAAGDGGAISDETSVISIGGSGDGGESGADDYYNGLFDLPSIYNCVLSSSEIALLYQKPFCFMEPSWNWVLYGAISIPTVGGQVIFIN